MKNLLTVLALVALTGSVIAATPSTTSSSKIQSYVDSKLSPVTSTESEIKSKIEAQKTASEESKAAAEAKKTEAKNAVESTKSTWKSLISE